MIRVYGSGGARSRRVLWTCEETGAPYEFVALKMPVREHHPEFLEVSPAGALPAMEHGAIRMVESLAISEYVARLFGLGDLIAPGVADYEARLKARPAYQRAHAV